MDGARLLTGGRIKTMDPGNPTADSILLCGQRIAAVGTGKQVMGHPLAFKADKIDLEGRRVIPGIIDGHLHFAAWSEGKMAVDLSGCRSIHEVVEKLKERAASLPDGRWIRGMHFDHSRFAENRLPDRSDLDAVKNPVLLTRVCYHAHCANSRALELAGMRDRKDLPGGVQRDGAGNLTGVVLESGADLLYDAFRRDTPVGEEHLEGMAASMREMASYGVTSISTSAAVHIGIDESFGPYQELRRRGRLLQRATIHVNDLLPFGISSFLGDEMIRYGGLKLFADGGFCARTAAMSFEYRGMPGYRGELNYDPVLFREIVSRAQEQGVQVAVHTNGDRAMDMVLDAMERAAELFPRPWLRHKLLHCYVVRPEQAARMAALGVVADVQPVFVSDEIDIAEEGVPEEMLPFSYAWKSLREAGIIVAASSDCPAASPNPWRGVDAAVNRVRVGDRTPVGGWYPGQKMDLDEALEMFTSNASFSIGMERVLGSLEPGKFADLVVLEDDPWEMADGDLSGVRVFATFRGGETIFGKL